MQLSDHKPYHIIGLSETTSWFLSFRKTIFKPLWDTKITLHNIIEFHKTMVTNTYRMVRGPVCIKKENVLTIETLTRQVLRLISTFLIKFQKIKYIPSAFWKSTFHLLLSYY